MLPADRWSATINGIGLGFFLIGTIWSTWLAVNSGFLVALVLALLFLISTLLYWTIQTTYHILKREDHPRERLRRFDHATMFILIAGTFTPCINRYCDPIISILVISVLWICVAISTPLMLFWKQVRKSFSFEVSFIMAILSIIALSISLGTIPALDIVLFFVGMALFIVGAVVLARNTPNIRPGVFTSHELFHSFVLAAMIVLYFLVVSALSV